MAAQRDYYEVLGVARDADAKAIKDAFRELAMRYHPDRNKTPDAEERFKEIAEAYAILSDPKKRAQYDTGGFAGVADFSAEDLFGGINFGDIFGDMGFGFDFGGGIFDRLFRHGRERPARGRDIEVVLRISLDRVNSGGEEDVRFHRHAVCPTCKGSGAAHGTEPRKCTTCGGTGQKVTTREQTRDKGTFRFQQISECPDCHGRGVIIDRPCPECHGRGEIEKEERLKVQIPKGVEDGTALRISGHGMASEQPGAPAGDLYVLVTTAPDARFRRARADLWRGETIDVADAVLGTTVRVPGLEGTIEVTVPPGTQPDEVLRLRGKGLPVFGGVGRGDLNIQITVHIPENLSEQEKALYERLKAMGANRVFEKKHWWK